MAQLKFSGIQPVSFDNRDCMPALDNSKILRLGRLKFDTEANIEEADKILASCFPDDEDFVYEFLSTKMLATDKRILQSYLLNGEKSIAMLDRSIDALAEKALEKGLEAQNA